MYPAGDGVSIDSYSVFRFVIRPRWFRSCCVVLFGFFSQCYEQTSLVVTTNLPFADWPQVFADDERLAGALLDRLCLSSTDGTARERLDSPERLPRKGWFVGPGW